MSLPVRSVRGVAKLACAALLASAPCGATSLLLVASSASRVLAEDQALTQALHSLHDAHDFRVRTQAAFTLGHSRDASYADALALALRDRHPVVRAAAATALGYIASPRSLPALRVATGDAEVSVSEQARTAIASIEVSVARAAQLTAAQAHVSTQASKHAKARYGLVLGQMHNESGFSREELALVLQTTLARELGNLQGVALFGPQDASAVAEAQKQGLPVLRLEGNVVQIASDLDGEQLSVHCEVSLLLLDEPGRTLRTILKGAATGLEGTMGKRSEQEHRIARKAVDGAVRSALRNATSVIENVVARAQVNTADTASASLAR